MQQAPAGDEPDAFPFVSALTYKGTHTLLCPADFGLARPPNHVRPLLNSLDTG